MTVKNLNAKFLPALLKKLLQSMLQLPNKLLERYLALSLVATPTSKPNSRISQSQYSKTSTKKLD